MLAPSFAIFALIPKRADLILVMAKREISDRYAGQALGMFWALGHPLFLTAL